MSARFKVDEALPRQIADLLTVHGHDAATVGGRGWQGMSDEILWPRVQNEWRWLMTADKGFADLRQYPPGSHAGVILLRSTGGEPPGRIWNLPPSSLSGSSSMSWPVPPSQRMLTSNAARQRAAISSVDLQNLIHSQRVTNTVPSR